MWGFPHIYKQFWDTTRLSYMLSHSVVSETVCDPMDGSPPGSSVHGISQAKIPEWVAIPHYTTLTHFLHYLPRDYNKFHRLSVQSCKTDPHPLPPDVSCKLKLSPMLLTSWLKIGSSIERLPPWFRLEWLTELRGTFYLLGHQFIIL